MSEQPVINTRSDLVTAIDYIYRLQAEIDRLKAERRWIPVKNRHPEHGERVFVKMRNGWVGAANYANRKENAYRWMNTDGKGYLFEVTHWMPLPAEPPSEEE